MPSSGCRRTPPYNSAFESFASNPFVRNPCNSFIKTTFLDASLLMPLYASKMLLLNSAFAFCFSEFCFAFLRFEILLCKMLSNSAMQFCLLNFAFRFCLRLMHGCVNAGNRVYFQNRTISKNEIVAFPISHHLWPEHSDDNAFSKI